MYNVRSNNQIPNNKITLQGQNLKNLRKVQNYGALCLEGKIGTINNTVNQVTDMLSKPLIFPESVPVIQYNGTSALYFLSSTCNNDYVSNVNSMNAGLTVDTIN